VEVIRTNGFEIAYERVGEGPPLVLVHGAAVDSRMWRPQLAALADEFTVVAWDEPGAGRSSDVPADFALADYANCLAALIETLDLGPAHVAGLSWGGTLAQELYRHHPKLVSTLLLVDTYAGWKGSLPEGEVRARVEGVRQMLTAADHVVRPHASGAVRRRSASPVRVAPGGDGRRRSPREHEDCAACDGRGRPA
jgi:pimeloyl-ACP methyl ester carboxylesterase